MFFLILKGTVSGNLDLLKESQMAENEALTTPNVPMPQSEDEFPQYLCKTCGRCCRSITTALTHEQLKELASEGEEEARVFTEIFHSFPTHDDARKVVPEQIEQILKVMGSNGIPPEQITFYYCPHITEKNLCSMYLTRPECCRRAPRNGWSVMPPGCGFEGWQFEQREKHKKTVRFFKEYLHSVESLSDDGKVPGKDMTVEEFRNDINEKLKAWEKFGAKDW